MADTETKVEPPADNGQPEPEDGEGGDAAAKAAAKKEKEKLKKQKQKEKEKAKKEETKKKTEAPKKKAPVAAIQAALKKKQEDEERLRLQQEEEERLFLEKQRDKEEKARLEKERKEREKQKKKDRIAAQKKAGTYMTPAEKAKMRIAQEKLALLQQQGDVVLGKDEKQQKINEREQRKRQKPKPKAEQEQKAETPKIPDGSEKEVVDDDDTKQEGEEEGSDIADEWDASSEEDEGDENESTGSAAENGQQPDSHSPTDSLQKLSLKDAAPATSAAGTPTEEDKPIINKSKRHHEVVPDNETAEDKRDRIRLRIKKRAADALEQRKKDCYRAPVICVLGHVDTGKTKMLDRIRRTNVQDGEAGGITQQIGATQVPASAIQDQGKGVKDFSPKDVRIPGFLIIDTPGHESFRNLRSRGSSLCDIAILIVDIMHGLEPQTLESIDLLIKKNCPFVIGLNKVDRIYEWKSDPKKDIRELIKSQKNNVQIEFNERVKQVVTQFAEKSINVALYWENPDPDEYFSMVPTSAFMGDGVGNLMVYLCQHAQSHLRDRITYIDNLECTVMEVKEIHGLGTTIDVLLVQGRLRVGDKIVLAGTDGPIVTQIRDLLMPPPLRELRIKAEYTHSKDLQAAQGVKVLAKGLEKALAGLPLHVARDDDETEYLSEEVERTLDAALKGFKTKNVGVYVQASTLGSLEALLEFLRSQKIPYCGINIGPVHKRDVMKASTMLEHDPQMSVILAFDVKIEREAQSMADELGVRIFHADIIYHLQDAFIKHREEIKEKEKKEHERLAIFPCRLKVLAQHVFKTRDPIICGVTVEAGVLKVNTPLCVPQENEVLQIGAVSSIEYNNKPMDKATVGQEVCIKIENTTGDAPRMLGRHFTDTEPIVSRITRDSIDVCKKYFRDDLSKADWQLVVELKKKLDIM